MITRPSDLSSPAPDVELEELRARLEEAESTLEAIRNGEVDALVVSGEHGEKVYTLQTAETPYRELVESMNEGAVTVDRSGTIFYANHCFAQMLGLPLERVQGSALSSHASIEGAQSIDESLSQTVAKGSDRRIVALLREGQPPLAALMSARALPDDSGGGICAVFTDLTLQRREEALVRAEEEARMHRDLAERRAAELARSNADLERFAQIASHDLKEPLRGISNYASFLIEDHGPQISEEGREKLETIMRLSKRMHGLLDSLLEYAKVGRTPAKPVQCNLGEILRDVIDSIGKLLAERNAQVVIEGVLPGCSCDRVRLGQALTNLIANAVKYNDSPAPLINISAEVRGSDAIVLRIRDNGIGIDPRHHDRIFNIFTRLHPRDRYGGGTGVGLSIVKSIAEQHGGRVWVQSAPGDGSSFFLQLPA